MKSSFGITVVLCLIIMGCTTSKDEPGRVNEGQTTGRATINVSGDVNTVTTMGTGNQGTRVGCLRNPGAKFSDISLWVEGTSKYKSYAKEALYISFQSADYPIGHVSFPSSSQVSYVVGEDHFTNVGSSKDCYANLSPVGTTSLSGTISCKGMTSERGSKVDIQATFECSVMTLN